MMRLVPTLRNWSTTSLKHRWCRPPNWVVHRAHTQLSGRRAGCGSQLPGPCPGRDL